MRYQEDPIENALLCIAQAETGCADCKDFHLRSILRRTHIATNEKTGDLAEFNAATRLVLERLSRGLPIVRVGIVGSTDTGLLANLAALAHSIDGTDLVGRLDIELIDRCATPLAICRAFADRHNIKLSTQQSDFMQISRSGQFDLILMHGVIPFFPADQQQDYLRHIASWLSNFGRLVSSTHLGTKPYQNTDTVRTQMAIDSLKQLANTNPTIEPKTVDLLVARLQASSETQSVQTTVFPDSDIAVAAYQAAGLEVKSHWVVQLESSQAAKHFRRYSQRSIVICGRGS